MIEPSTFSSIEGQVVVSTIAVWVIQKLKASSLVPFIHQGTPGSNKFLSVALASMASAGFTVAHTGSLDAGGTITIAFPAMQQMVEFAVHTMFAYITQQGVYHGYVKQEVATPPAPQPKGE